MVLWPRYPWLGCLQLLLFFMGSHPFFLTLLLLWIGGAVGMASVEGGCGGHFVLGHLPPPVHSLLPLWDMTLVFFQSSRSLPLKVFRVSPYLCNLRQLPLGHPQFSMVSVGAGSLTPFSFAQVLGGSLSASLLPSEGVSYFHLMEDIALPVASLFSVVI